MTEAQYEELLAQMKPVPYMIIGGQAPRSQQENANLAWEKLGDILGFKHMTVRPGNSKLSFTAEPKD